VAAGLEQRVTGREAWLGWRRLVHRHGEVHQGRPAVGPARAPVSRRRPDDSQLGVADMHVDAARSRVVVGAAIRHDALQRTLDMSSAAADEALRSLPGVGVWTSAEVRQRAHGDCDAVSFGDYHVPTQVGLALLGRPVDDAQMAALLEEHRPHRYRVQRLVELSGVRRSGEVPAWSPDAICPGSR
jgi:3-methyladenine DNA glycosylase/8-oxoguanine DNA glycosylase